LNCNIFELIVVTYFQLSHDTFLFSRHMTVSNLESVVTTGEHAHRRRKHPTTWWNKVLL